jgi:hypothetical protein
MGWKCALLWYCVGGIVFCAAVGAWADWRERRRTKFRGSHPGNFKDYKHREHVTFLNDRRSTSTDKYFGRFNR